MDLSETISEVRRIYDTIGERYDRQTGAFKIRVAYPRLHDELVRLLGMPAGKRVLDVGCGSGNLMLALEAAGMACEGVDVSTLSIATAAAKGLRVREASMLSLPFPDESFDAAISFHSFNYVPYERQLFALLEQRRVLKGGGVFVAACFCTEEETCKEVRFLMFGEKFRLYPCSAQRLIALMTAAGFSDILCETLTCDPIMLEGLIAASGNPDEVGLLTASRGKPYAFLATARKK